MYLNKRRVRNINDRLDAKPIGNIHLRAVARRDGPGYNNNIEYATAETFTTLAVIIL